MKKNSQWFLKLKPGDSVRVRSDKTVPKHLFDVFKDRGDGGTVANINDFDDSRKKQMWGKTVQLVSAVFSDKTVKVSDLYFPEEWLEPIIKPGDKVIIKNRGEFDEKNPYNVARWNDGGRMDYLFGSVQTVDKIKGEGEIAVVKKGDYGLWFIPTTAIEDVFAEGEAPVLDQYSMGTVCGNVEEDMRAKTIPNGEIKNSNSKEKTIMAKLTTAFKLLTDKSTQTLRKAGFINGDLELTADGQNALLAIALETHKEALVKVAEEVIEEAEKQK